MFFLIGKAQPNVLSMQKGATLTMKDSSLLYIQGSFVLDSMGKGNPTKLVLNKNANLVVATAKNSIADWVNHQQKAFFIEGEGTVWLAANHNQRVLGTVKNQNNTSFHNLFLADNYPIDSKKSTEKSLFSQYNDIEVRGTLHLNSEYLVTNENDVWVVNPDTNAVLRTGRLTPPFENNSQLGMVTSKGNGRLIRATQIDKNYLYPVGQISNSITEGFYPVLLRPKGSSFNFYGMKTVVSSPIIDIGAEKEVAIDTVTKKFYQQINHLAGVERCDIRLFYNNNFDLNLTSDSINTIVQWNDAKGWSNMGSLRMGKSATLSVLGFNASFDDKMQLPFAKGIRSENVTVAKVNNRKAKADFDAKNTKGCAPLVVSFTNKSVNTLNWYWKFPGGKPDTSTALNPVVTYDIPGVYPVYLYVSNLVGQDSLVKTDYITVQGKPIPAFTYKIVGKDKVEITNTTQGADQMSWVINGKPYFTKDLNFVVELEKSGLQSIKLIARNNCGVSDLTISFQQDLSIACREMNPQFRPNPSADVSYLVFNGEPTTDLPYMVCTEDGRILQRGEIKARTKIVEFDMVDLPSAMYLFIVDCNGALIVRKVIKQGY
jgi:PKD domain